MSKELYCFLLLRTEGSSEWNTSDLTARLAWINWDSLGVGPSRRGMLANLQLSVATPPEMAMAGIMGQPPPQMMHPHAGSMHGGPHPPPPHHHGMM